MSQQLSDSKTTIHLLQSRLEETERVAMHSQELHDQLGGKEMEMQGLNIRIQVRDVCEVHVSYIYSYIGSLILRLLLINVSL